MTRSGLLSPSVSPLACEEGTSAIPDNILPVLTDSDQMSRIWSSPPRADEDVAAPTGMPRRRDPEPFRTTWLARLAPGGLRSRASSRVLPRAPGGCEHNPQCRSGTRHRDRHFVQRSRRTGCGVTGALHRLLGLPVTVKDSLEMAGMVTSGGRVARSANIRQRDASAIGRLLAVGPRKVGSLVQASDGRLVAEG